MNPHHRSLTTDHRPQSRTRRSRAGFTLAKRRERLSAFTLVELLIATGITVAMVLMLGLMLGSLMGNASHATARVDAFRDARAAVQVIERDLRNLVRTQWSPDPFSSPTPTPGTVQPLTLPAAYFAVDNIYPDSAIGNQQLYALVADQTAPSSGDVCAVGYYCQWDSQLHAYSLRRFFRGSTDTYAVMRNAQQQAGYAADSVLYTPSSGDPVLAAYVWNFKVGMYTSSGAVISPAPGTPYICDPNATTPNPLPAAIEISFDAMSPQAAQRVMAVTANNPTAYNVWMAGANPNPLPTDLQLYQQLIVPHMYQFRSRINLP